MKFWPVELSEKEAKLSVIPKLVETQDDFIALLGVAVRRIEDLIDIVNLSALTGNLFLKHLMVLSDFGGELIQRTNREFSRLFPTGKLEYLWREEGETSPRTYQFKALPARGLSNKKLNLLGRALLDKAPLTPLQEDITVLLLLGSAATDPEVASILSKCEVGNYLGLPAELDRFVRQRYIWVSRITGGAQSNTLGQLAQRYVYEYIETNLRLDGVNLSANGHVPNVRHTLGGDPRETTFDIVVSRDERYVAIEVSFQVTTNSVIERKSAQAQARYTQIESAGARIAYVLDGAGNFQRRSALRTLCDYSHCTVAFSPAELNLLCEFIREYLTLDSPE